VRVARVGRVARLRAALAYPVPQAAEIGFRVEAPGGPLALVRFAPRAVGAWVFCGHGSIVPFGCVCGAACYLVVSFALPSVVGSSSRRYSGAATAPSC